MLNRQNRFLSALLIAACVAASGTSLFAKADNESMQAEIESLDIQLGYLKIKLSDSKKKSGRLEKMVKEKQTQIKELAMRIDGLNAGQKTIASQTAVLMAEAEILKTEQSMLLERFRARLVQLYKTKQGTMIESVFASKDMNSFLNRYQMVKYMLNTDKKLFDEMKEQALQQKKLEETLQHRKAQLEESKTEIAKQNAKLEKEKKALNAMLSTVLLEKKVFLAREKALAKSREQLEARISEVEKQQDSEALNKELVQAPAAQKTPPKIEIGTLPESAPKGARIMNFCWPVLAEQRLKISDNTDAVSSIGIEVKPDTPVLAAKRGKVAYRGNIGGFGNVVIISHEKGFSTVYGCLDEMWVGLGQIVEQGEEIGRLIGGANTTLHFEIRFGGKRQPPLDYLAL